MNGGGVTIPETLAELVPLLRRLDGLDPATLVRLRIESAAGADGEPARTSATLFASLPFGVLISRTVPVAPRPADGVTVDVAALRAAAGAAHASAVLGWLLGEHPAPERHDEQWRGALPPVRGWRRIESLDDAVVRDRVRAGALALKELSSGAEADEQVRQPAIEALLDSVVLTVTADEKNPLEPVAPSAAISLRTLSALVRMGFVPRDSQVSIDLCRGWVRVVGVFGAAYAGSTDQTAAGGMPGLLPVLR